MLRTDKPFLDALNGHVTDKIPFWFMRQAGRYLPEYRDLRESAGGFLEMAYNPDIATEITMQPIRRFGMDAAIIFSDILTIPHALGQHLEFAQGEGPKLDPINEASDISRLDFSKFDQHLAPVYQALKQTKAALTSEGFANTALIGFAGSPWTVATYMIEGGSSKDFFKTKSFAYAQEEEFSNLINILIEATASYLINQIAAGAECVQLFDSWAGALDSNSFKKWVIKPTKQIVDLVKDSHPDVPIIGFPRMAGTNYLDYVQGTGVNGIGLDHQVNLKWAARTLQPLACLQGNLDPAALMAGGDALILATEQIITELRQGPFVFNLGHGIHKDTPVEHVEQLVDLIKGM
ncbi:MAG: uroporphyrinogen decarboxylase [Alphaproteobacteria bacterium]|nr:uroporphyrinogen decarboxylase [Alphaproteobacteria bacterium]